MKIDGKAALFLMLGQAAEKGITKLDEIAPASSLMISGSYDLAPLVPSLVKQSSVAAEAYRLFFVFEGYLRDFVVEVLSKDGQEEWWDKVPGDVQAEVVKLEETEEMKAWMALGSRGKSALLTLPQLLKIIDHNWKDAFGEFVRDKSLIQEGRMIVHLRNTICHMSVISEEELDRVKQTMRDWFRVIAP